GRGSWPQRYQRMVPEKKAARSRYFVQAKAALSLERRNNRSLVFVGDKLADLWAVEGLDELGHVRIVLFGGGSNHNVGIGGIGAFNEQRIFDRVQAGFQRIIGIDQRDVYIGQHAWQRGGFEFAELQLLGVFNDIARC